ncbi:LOW QUALITY PROTEIN: hypothetical protein QTO34_013840 [Cnephaeus nilssonii]|uniref:Uncharacterized protein n=1 Tax=Cnephaeus nilssonii TaxID=3371016 RepID=A0AA40I9T1_CNENI|nr:LOW QUALITY PROTEIN: hypothetical protein QTO34_013840 [Eptesicus nilssonii]
MQCQAQQHPPPPNLRNNISYISSKWWGLTASMRLPGRAAIRPRRCAAPPGGPGLSEHIAGPSKALSNKGSHVDKSAAAGLQVSGVVDSMGAPPVRGGQYVRSWVRGEGRAQEPEAAGPSEAPLKTYRVIQSSAPSASVCKREAGAGPGEAAHPSPTLLSPQRPPEAGPRARPAQVHTGILQILLEMGFTLTLTDSFPQGMFWNVEPSSLAGLHQRKTSKTAPSCENQPRPRSASRTPSNGSTELAQV